MVRHLALRWDEQGSIIVFLLPKIMFRLNVTSTKVLTELLGKISSDSGRKRP